MAPPSGSASTGGPPVVGIIKRGPISCCGNGEGGSIGIGAVAVPMDASTGAPTELCPRGPCVAQPVIVSNVRLHTAAVFIVHLKVKYAG